jgi:hypothetical protein
MISYKSHKQAEKTISKLVHLFFVLSLSLVLLVGSYMAMSCLCNRCLPTTFQNLNLNLKSASSNGPSSNSARTCNFINGKAVKTGSFNKQITNAKTLPTFIVSNPCNYFFDRFQISQALLQKVALLPVAALYLKNLSLRC